MLVTALHAAEASEDQHSSQPYSLIGSTLAHVFSGSLVSLLFQPREVPTNLERLVGPRGSFSGDSILADSDFQLETAFEFIRVRARCSVKKANGRICGSTVEF